MKKVLVLALLAATVLPLAGCKPEEKPVSEYADTDFDGLYDSIDDLCYDNEYRYYYENEEEETKTNEFSLKLDYRNFLKTDFNENVSQLSGVLISFGYDDYHDKWNFTKNSYISDESSINKGLVNFGFSNIKKCVIGIDDNEIDSCDIGGMYLGNHIFVNDDGKKYQVIAGNINGYPEDYAWNSNFDFGADIDGYYDVVGKDHPDWLNRKHHKGFDVTTNRIYPFLTSYINDVKVDGVEQIIWVFGHSRSGSLTNLIGKRLFDDGYRSICYAFNNPNTTLESDKAVLNKYNNIFNIRCTQDLLSKFPFAYQGFDVYGKKYIFDLTKNNVGYKEIFKKDFVGNSLENINACLDTVKELYPTLDYFYTFDKDYEDNIALESKNETDLQAELNEVKASLESIGYDKITTTKVVENPDYDEKNEDSVKYYLNYNIKPIAVFKAIGNVLVLAKTTLLPAVEIASYIATALPYVNGLLLKFFASLLAHNVELEPAKFSTPHFQPTVALGAYYVEPLEE